MFLLAIFRSSTHRRRKLMAYLDSWGNSEQETCAFYAKNIWKFDLIRPDLGMTSVKSQVGWRHSVQWLSLSISACKMTQKNMCRAACLRLLFYGGLLWPDLDVDLLYVLTRYSFWTSIQHFGWVWPLCIPSNRPESPKGENTPLWPLTWPWPGSWP